MADEAPQGATMMIRAWKDPDGALTARITYGVDGRDPSLEIVAAHSVLEVLAVVREWMTLIETPAEGAERP